MTAKEFVKKYQSTKVYGTAITSFAPKWPQIVKNAGLDFVFLDTEHIVLGRETLAQMCNVYSAHGILPIARIPSPDPYTATMVLDGGAVGILAPYIETVEQVKQLVGAVKYRPLKGKKLEKLLNDPDIIDNKLQDYINDRCKNNLLFINIESKPAVDNLAELLNVPGLDGVIIGPHDLSCSLDIPEEYSNPVFDQAVEKIIQECIKRNMGIGIHLSEEPEYQIKWGKAGVNIVLHSSDMVLFSKMLQYDMNKIKTSFNDITELSEQESIIV